jgi:hypothetical protein
VRSSELLEGSTATSHMRMIPSLIHTYRSVEYLHGSQLGSTLVLVLLLVFCDDIGFLVVVTFFEIVAVVVSAGTSPTASLFAMKSIATLYG